MKGVTFHSRKQSPFCLRLTVWIRQEIKPSSTFRGFGGVVYRWTQKAPICQHPAVSVFSEPVEPVARSRFKVTVGRGRASSLFHGKIIELDNGIHAWYVGCPKHHLGRVEWRKYGLCCVHLFFFYNTCPEVESTPADFRARDRIHPGMVARQSRDTFWIGERTVPVH